MCEYLANEAPHLTMGIIVTTLAMFLAIAVGSGKKNEIDANKPALGIVSVGLYGLGMWLLTVACGEARWSWIWAAISMLVLTVFSTGTLIGLLPRDVKGHPTIKKNSPEYRIITKFLKVPVDAREWSLCGLSWAIGPMLILMPAWYLFKWTIGWIAPLLLGVIYITILWFLGYTRFAKNLKALFDCCLNPRDYGWTEPEYHTFYWINDDFSPEFVMIGGRAPSQPILWIGLCALGWYILVHPVLLLYLIIPLALASWIVISLVVGGRARRAWMDREFYSRQQPPTHDAYEAVPENAGEKVVGMVADSIDTVVGGIAYWIGVIKGRVCPVIKIED